MTSLDPLLTALRQAGLPVGVTEVARLRQVFALGPQRDGDPDGRRLKAVLRAVLVKSAEDRIIFDSVFETWLNGAGHDLARRAEPVHSPFPRTDPSPPRRRIRQYFWRTAAAMLGLLGLALGGHVKVPMFKAEPPPPVLAPAPPHEPAPVIQTGAVSPDEIRKRMFNTWVPTIIVTPGESLWQGWPPFLLGVLALATAGGLWIALRRRPWLPLPAPEPAKKGPSRIFLTSPPSVGPELLAPREEEALVWGIGQFVAEEPTRRLDLAATVRATAQAGGIPRLHFHQARYPREVWLWVDEAASDADPSIQRLAGEIETVLHAQHLPIERSLFRGVPDWLVGASGQIFAPNEVDERRDAALVAILTDGRILARQYSSDDRRVRLDSLLRGLSRWPHLAFVDFASEPAELASILAKHAIPRVTPMELAAFLGSDEALRRKAVTLGQSDAAWAAACALSPSSVAELQAFELRRRLGLAASPWALRALRNEAPGPAGRLQWGSPVRALRVNWLRASEDQVEDGGSVFGRALAFWEESYDRELKGLSAEASEETPASQHLVMERALLSLWRESEVPAAVRELYRLHGGTPREVIERHLGGLAPLDYGGQEHVHLAWQWSDRSGTERVMLREMGLGGDMPLAALQRPGRMLAGVGLSLGLAIGALGVAAVSGMKLPEVPPVVVSVPPVQIENLGSPGRHKWKVTAETHKSFEEKLVSGGAKVQVLWEANDLPCVASVGITEIWRCGTLAAPTRLGEAPGMRMIGLAAAPGTPGAVGLAIALLDSGSADVVTLRSDWKNPNFSAHPLLVLSPDSPWAELAQSLHFSGLKTVAQVWPNLHPLVGSPNALLRGLNEMIFVHIPGGTFRMGSTAEDLRAHPQEKPAHEVTLSQYWIGKYEVTDAQYGGQNSDNRPVTDVSWYDADDFCKRNGWRLPTEAEWEYAARAGTQAAWSFGDDEKVLGDFAWFEGNSGGNLYPVGTRKPNPWGIYDMHGNAWEWVADWWGPYGHGAQTDPTGPSSGILRVLRGGASGNPPRVLRSADRDWMRPTARVGDVGFRCARGPSPPTPLPPPSHPVGRGARRRPTSKPVSPSPGGRAGDGRGGRG